MEDVIHDDSVSDSGSYIMWGAPFCQVHYAWLERNFTVYVAGQVVLQDFMRH